MRQPLDPRLYLVTDSNFVSANDLDQVVEQAVRGGVTLVQIREKNRETNLFVQTAKSLLQRLRPLGIPLIVNDSVPVAMAIGADGVHLGPTDLSPTEARRILGSNAWIGLSVENRDQLKNSFHLPIDYVAASPVFPTLSKKDPAPAIGIEGLREFSEMTRLPLIAIGGIKLENVMAVLEAGASGVAVISAILASSNPRQAALELRNSIDRVLKTKKSLI